MRTSEGEGDPTGSQKITRVGAFLLSGTVVIIYLRYKNYIMTNEQFKNAVNEVKNLLTETNSEWEYDSSDAMDGFVFVTICRPQTQEEKDGSWED